MAQEGLTLLEDFADFSEKEDLNVLYCTLLKPAKTADGAVVNARLREEMMAYYTMVGHTI